jgi:hypothetical protein
VSTFRCDPQHRRNTDSSRRHWNDERIYLRDYLDGVALFDDVLLEYASTGGYRNRLKQVIVRVAICG